MAEGNAIAPDAKPRLPRGVRLTNSEAQQNITWNSGASFERPTSIVPPTIARFGLKFDW